MGRQPALNFGWTHLPDDESWRDPVDAPGPRRNRQMLKDVLDFWLSRGVAGFRVDMAFSLVKDDRDPHVGLLATTELWREVRQWLDDTHPDAVLLPEGSEPRIGASFAFDADFLLVIPLGAALTFLFTWGSVPCLYYGDEVGMRYLPGLPDVEGAAVLLGSGVAVDGQSVQADGFGYAVLALSPRP
jgi:glycosidase